MHKIDTPGHVNNLFVDKDPANEIDGTIVDDEWLNAVQGELVAVIESMGGTLQKGTNDQAWKRIERILGRTNAGDPNGVLAADKIHERCWDTSQSPPIMYIATAADGTIVGTTWSKAFAFLAGGNVFNGAQVFNEAGADVDFRIEGASEPNLFFLDASTNRIGIGTATPSKDVELRKSADGPVDFQARNDDGAGLAALTEFRAVSDTGAAGDFGIACSSFNDGSPLLPEEVFLVAESNTAGMNLKNNNNSGSWIRFVIGTGVSLEEVARINGQGSFCFGHAVNNVGSPGTPLVANNQYYSAISSDQLSSIGLIGTDGADRVSINCNSAHLDFANAVESGTLGAQASHIKVRVGGVDRAIPVHDVT